MDGTQINNVNKSSVNALLLLFVFDKMDIPLTEKIIAEIVCTRNNWISYMDYKQALTMLIDKKWISQVVPSVPDADTYYNLTVDGRVCLSHLFFNIPSSIRAEVTEFVNEHRMNCRREQEYLADYSPNADGSYTVMLRIADVAIPNQSILEINMCVENRQTATTIYKKWKEKAAEIYSLIYDNLII